jgi:hypothetical protein
LFDRFFVKPSPIAPLRSPRTEGRCRLYTFARPISEAAPVASEKMGDFRLKTGKKNQKTGEFLSSQGENCQLRLTFSMEEV